MRRPRYTPRGMSLQQVRTASELYRDGWTTERVASLFGVTEQRIRRMLSTRGIPLRSLHTKPWGGDGSVRRDKDEAGVIVTLRRQSDGELLAMHRPGRRGDALRAVCEYIDAQPDDWRLFCYSTAPTIATDLQGGRVVKSARGDAMIFCPEANALSSIGRLDLLDPDLVR